MLISAGRAGGSIGRDMKLPAVSSIDFDLSWRGMLALMLCFYTDSFEAYTGNSNSYTLNINQGSMYLQRMRRVVGGFVEQDVAEAPPQNDADHREE